MALPAPDMESCCKKQRCLSGPNIGQVYDVCDPCQGTGVFNVETCDCDIPCDAPATATVYWKVSYETYGTGCSPTTKSCSAFGGVPYSLQVIDLVPGSEIEITTQGSGVTGTCSGTENTVTVINYMACVEGSPAFRTTVLGAPGCSVNTSAGAIATPYDTSITYD